MDCDELKTKIHPKLSETLQQLLDVKETQLVTLDYILLRTRNEGISLLVILLTLPFLIPNIPGISTPFGLAIAYLAGREMFGKKKKLPKWLGRRSISSEYFPKIIRGTVKCLRFIEKGVKPRHSWWMELPGIQIFHWGIIGFLGVLLALPLPIPGSNLLPAYALLILTASVMEEDGGMVWLGYFLSLASIVWIGAAAYLGEEAVSWILSLF